ncbi:MAG: substrate-binding domain-containing protein [Anaerolineae bacterium]
MPTIGFANLTEDQNFPRRVQEGLEKAARAHGLDVIVRNNAMDNERAMENVRFFAEERVDICIIYHIDERYNPNLTPILMRKGIPIITVDIPMPLSLHYGVDNDRAGLLAGQAAAEWVNRHWGGKIDKLLGVTDSRLLGEIQNRLTKAVDVLSEHTTLDHEDVLYISGDSSDDITRERALTVLERWEDYSRILILGLNDESALGTLEAAHLLGRDADVAAVGQGANLLNMIYREKAHLRLIGSVNFEPERYGIDLVDMSLRILSGEKLPRINTFEPGFISREQWEAEN